MRRETPLLDACGQGDLDEVCRLLATGVDPNEEDGAYSAVTLVLANPEHTDGLEILRLLVEHGADANGVEVDFRWTPLMRAAERGDLELVELLLARGARVDLADVDGGTALDFAARAGHLDVLQRLLAVAPDRRGEPGLWAAALRGAAARGDDAAIERILAECPELIRDRADVVEAWAAACSALCPSTMELLRRSLGEPLTRDELGQGLIAVVHNTAALERAGSFQGIVRALVEAGADPDVPDLHGRAPLFYANVELAELLLGLGASVDARTPSGVTPLMEASGRHDLAMTQLLIERGADVRARDRQGRYASAYADQGPKSIHHREAIALLERANVPKQAWRPDVPPPRPGDTLSLIAFAALLLIIAALLVLLRWL